MENPKGRERDTDKHYRANVTMSRFSGHGVIETFKFSTCRNPCNGSVEFAKHAIAEALGEIEKVTNLKPQFDDNVKLTISVKRVR